MEANFSYKEFMEMTIHEFNVSIKGYFKREKNKSERIAAVMALVANIYRNTKKRPKPYTIQDFLGTSTKDKRQQTPEDMIAVMEMFVASMGGKDLRKKGGESN